MYSKKDFERFGDLDCLVYESGHGPYTVILLHGFGADAGDLYPLAKQLSLPQVGRWVFPNGRLPAAGAPTGRAWFPIDMAAYERAMQSGDFRDFSNIPDGIGRARKSLAGLIQSLGVEPEKIILGGFSQGAMASTHYILNTKQTFAGLAILSGTFLGTNEWLELAKAREPISFFQSHGKQDAVLPFSAAEKLYQILSKAGWSGDFIPFHGGHEIPPQVLMGFRDFVSQSISK